MTDKAMYQIPEFQKRVQLLMELRSTLPTFEGFDVYNIDTIPQADGTVQIEILHRITGDRNQARWASQMLPMLHHATQGGGYMFSSGQRHITTGNNRLLAVWVISITTAEPMEEIIPRFRAAFVRCVDGKPGAGDQMAQAVPSNEQIAQENHEKFKNAVSMERAMVPTPIGGGQDVRGGKVPGVGGEPVFVPTLGTRAVQQHQTATRHDFAVD